MNKGIISFVFVLHGALLLNGCVSNSVAERPKNWAKEIVTNNDKCMHITGEYKDLHSDGANLEPYIEYYDGKRFTRSLTEGSLYFWMQSYSKERDYSKGEIVTTDIFVENNKVLAIAKNNENKEFTSKFSLGKNVSCKSGRLVIKREYKGQGESHRSYSDSTLVISSLESGDLILHEVEKTYTNSALIINYWNNSEKWVLFQKVTPHNKSLKAGTQQSGAP